MACSNVSRARHGADSPGTVLETILAHKRREVADRKAAATKQLGRAECLCRRSVTTPRDLVAALQAPGVGLIAEVKRASPSRGALRPDLDPAVLARTYADNGAAAISVLTEARYFQGSLADLRAVREAVQIPVLMKDFILDPLQIYEGYAAGADAVLLIVAALTDSELRALQALAWELGMAALIEAHSREEVDRAVGAGASLIGINNRDLRSLAVSLETTASLCRYVSEDVVVVAESGIQTAADVARLLDLGIDAVLVGTALVTADDPAAATQSLVRAGRRVDPRVPRGAMDLDR